MLIIGAGVIGLAVGRSLAKRGREVIILERHNTIGVETSSRNSEVIHAGIYYPTGSLKAQLCVEGKELLYQYCEDQHIPHKRTGKIIVATNKDQLPVLKRYQELAVANGAGELTWMESEEIGKLEPEVQCVGGVYSPTTGIIDSHMYMLSLAGEIEASNGVLAFNSGVDSIEYTDEFLVRSSDITLKPHVLINAAGLQATSLSRNLGFECPTYFAKGHYYTLSGKSPFKHLIYPVADEGGLGVHVTLDLSGQARFGPDVVWIEDLDYEFCEDSRPQFIHEVRKYYPKLDESRLNPGYTGIRPKLVPKGMPPADFQIVGPNDHGIRSYIEFRGIESPGLTASLAIAELVTNLI